MNFLNTAGADERQFLISTDNIAETINFGAVIKSSRFGFVKRMAPLSLHFELQHNTVPRAGFSIWHTARGW